ncbi:MBL fold metallo-hydrolase [Demequina capsici]|uniref:MBL fold metallo-hydrolase n=1 Tax=Demequina capsici TaxID=3075620 RepID=A0AA96FGL5_9MICO|nr:MULTISPECIES: MBL fold metallo-hydrolase [unclassified Demequina]WNM25223.1 MBL fold metallo-hydrolase [Demequina sp. OYTSA14]WNM28136.1 MBL fold metallo-hydrolase [Demequina sp. PMTSA13]
MRLTVVGCSGSLPGPASPASCYLLQADDADGRTWSIVLDLGSGSVGALQRYVDPRDVDAIAISHTHADHCADLAVLDVLLKYHPDGPIALPVHGPFGLATRIAELRGADDHSEALPAYAWQPGAPVSIGPMTVTCAAVEHPVPAYGLRIEGPSEQGGTAVLAYSGDCDVCPGLGEVAADADVLLCEASFLESEDAPRGLHLTGARAGQVAQVAGVGRLLLTHVPPWTEPYEVVAEAAAEYAGPLDAVHAGMRVSL